MVGKHHRRERRGPYAAHFDDPDALSGPAMAAPCTACAVSDKPTLRATALTAPESPAKSAANTCS